MELWNRKFRSIRQHLNTVLRKPIFNGHLRPLFLKILIEGEENKYLLIGYDLAGTPLEILFNEIGENSFYVFHAMKCRKQLRDIANI
ncbi:hypothetical protein FACS189445_2100 [Spirochaetia bacterium]|nr:hypothetical protein FACS189445_2100 [Spirochaetia bacterium]